MIKESLQVACPRCGAEVGERCVSLKNGNRTVSTHTARDFTYLGKPLSPRWLPPEPKPPKPPSELVQLRALADDLFGVVCQALVWLDRVEINLRNDEHVADVLAHYEKMRHGAG